MFCFKGFPGLWAGHVLWGSSQLLLTQASAVQCSCLVDYTVLGRAPESHTLEIGAPRAPSHFLNALAVGTLMPVYSYTSCHGHGLKSILTFRGWDFPLFSTLRTFGCYIIWGLILFFKNSPEGERNSSKGVKVLALPETSPGMIRGTALGPPEHKARSNP